MFGVVPGVLHAMKQPLAIDPFAKLDRQLPATPCQERIELFSFFECTELPLCTGLVFILSLSQPINCMNDGIGG